MTQELINKYFQSELGQQCLSLFSTSDNKAFIRQSEAIEHEGTLTNELDNVIEWFDTSEYM